MTISQDIRLALQTTAITAAGFPPKAQRAYDNLPFSNTPGTPWVRMVYVPNFIRPFSVDTIDKTHAGLFLVNCFGPIDKGTADVENLGDAVRNVFAPGSLLVAGVDVVKIDYADRRDVMITDWCMCPVTIAWRTYSTRN